MAGARWSIDVAIVGGGAAGFFSAITIRENNPFAHVEIFEKSDQVLSKVKISGGGRCNLTNACESISALCSAYPRGGKALREAFVEFSNKDAFRWFEDHGVPLKVGDDLRVFPQSDRSQTIIDCLLQAAEKEHIMIRTGSRVVSIQQAGAKIRLGISGKQAYTKDYDRVIVTTGGSPERSGLGWLEKLGHPIEDPVPSLFSFNIPDESLKELKGVTVEEALVRLPGTKLASPGSLLITHWGMSGPAILRLSSFGARILHGLGYRFQLEVNWVHEPNQEQVLLHLRNLAASHPRKMLENFRPYDFSQRLWQFLLQRAGLPGTKTWGETGSKGLNKLMNVLTHDLYGVDGRTTFREEFVTCGGVSLEGVEIPSMQSKIMKNLYFAGEVLDIDAVTGGFNLQAAWTTGYLAGKSAGMINESDAYSLPTSQ